MPGSLRAAGTPNATGLLWSSHETDTYAVSLSTNTSGPNFTNASGSCRNTSLPLTTVPSTSSVGWSPDPMISADGGNLDDTATHRDFTRRMKHLTKMVNDFWRTEYYILFTWAKGSTPPSSNNKDGINDTVVGDVIVHDDKHPHGLWKLGSTDYRETPA